MKSEQHEQDEEITAGELIDYYVRVVLGKTGEEAEKMIKQAHESLTLGQKKYMEAFAKVVITPPFPDMPEHLK